MRKIRLSASFWEATRIAVDSLRKNKLRSFLTLLGIILATTTLIAVTALIHGMNIYIAEKVSNMGSDGFRVVRMAFFGDFDPKKFIEIEGVPYEVVGTAKALGSIFGQSQDNFVMIPIESYFKTYGNRNGIRIVAKAIDQPHLMEAQNEVRVLLRSYRHLRPGQDDTFTIFASETIVGLWERLTAAIAGMAIGIVSVFMIVGGIVIMN